MRYMEKSKLSFDTGKECRRGLVEKVRGSKGLTRSRDAGLEGEGEGIDRLAEAQLTLSAFPLKPTKEPLRVYRF